MHNNPEHMKRIERLQKTGMLQKPKTEAGQHIMNQLQKAKTSMTGGTTINFTHGDSKHVSGTHAARLLDKYAGMKPNEKEDFQKKIGHSHEKLKSEL
jgi:transposase-like protein